MEKRKKTNFAGSFTTVSLIMILIINLILTLLFVNYLRGIVVDLTKLNTKDNAAYSKELIVSGLKEHECTLENTGIGIAHFYRQRMLTDNIIKSYLVDMNERIPESLDIYFTNNIVWNMSGGLAVFASGWIPEDDWDNTARSWFTDAKKKEGRIAYSEPYVDADTGAVIVTLSKTVYDSVALSVFSERIKVDIGVIANDISVNNLGELTGLMKNFEGQEIYIINSKGLFITNEDINAVMKKDFFTEKNLEKYRGSVLGESDTFKMDKHFFIYSSVIPHTDWIIVSTIPASVVFSGANLLIIRLIIFSSLMFLCVAVISIIFAHRKLTVPLRDVLNFTDALAVKNYNVNISGFRNDEIGDIQISLIKIRDSLKSNIDSLNEHLLSKDNN